MRAGRRRPPRAPAPGPARRPGADEHQPAAPPGRPRCSSSAAAGSRPPRSSTSLQARPAVAGSASPTTTSTGWAAGWPAPTCAGGSTRVRGSGSRWTGSPTTPGASGLDRVLLGVAMSGDDHRHVGRGLPLDDVGSNEIDLAGRLAELLDRLGALPGRAGVGDHGRGLDGRAAVGGPRPRRGRRRRRLAAARSSSASWPGPRPRPRPVVPSSGSPTSGRCSSRGWRAARPGPTSAPAR